MFGAAAPGTMTNLGVGTTEEPEFTHIGTGAILGFNPAIANRVQHSTRNVSNRVVDRGHAILPTIRVGADRPTAVIATKRCLPRTVSRISAYPPGCPAHRARACEASLGLSQTGEFWFIATNEVVRMKQGPGPHQRSAARHSEMRWRMRLEFSEAVKIWTPMVSPRAWPAVRSKPSQCEAMSRRQPPREL